MTAPRPGRHADGELLVWHLRNPLLCVSSAPLGGGLGVRTWIVNAQVPTDYARTDLDVHLRSLAREQGCIGDGVGMLTAAQVGNVASATDRDVSVYATVGLTRPTWASDCDDAHSTWQPGTINVVAFLPVRLSDAALVNAVMTVTEAKTQALVEAGVPGTGTASDAVCIACPATGGVEPFGGPRSSVGAPLARATYMAISQRARPSQ